MSSWAGKRTSSPDMRHPYALCFVLALLAHPAAAHATVYKHVDAKGRVTYSDSPPVAPGAVKQVELPPAPSSPERRRALEVAAREREQLERIEAHRRTLAAREPRIPAEQPPLVLSTTPYTTGYWVGGFGGYSRRMGHMVHQPIARPFSGRASFARAR